MIMAKFVIAGKADCPYYAKAELLADYLQKNLPDFQIFKITQHPDVWEEWLKEVCEKNKWSHKKSPIVWRELLDRGGKALLLGGYNDFLEHAQRVHAGGLQPDPRPGERGSLRQPHRAQPDPVRPAGGGGAAARPGAGGAGPGGAPAARRGPVHARRGRLPRGARGRDAGRAGGVRGERRGGVPAARGGAVPGLRGAAGAQRARRGARARGGEELREPARRAAAALRPEPRAQRGRGSPRGGRPGQGGPRPETESSPRLEWVKNEFMTTLKTLTATGRHFGGILAAHSIGTTLKYWYQGSFPGEIVSLGVLSEGQFGIPEGIVFSMPVKFENGTWAVLTDLKNTEINREIMTKMTSDLIQEIRVALGEPMIFQPHQSDTEVPRRDENIVSVTEHNQEELRLSHGEDVISIVVIITLTLYSETSCLKFLEVFEGNERYLLSIFCALVSVRDLGGHSKGVMATQLSMRKQPGD
ncbi:putative malate dehydrogenase 1B isoform X11 [Cavia porcellus]|uniref:putative malate dehydrogenase 1B isoform X11 n=1 Tax=Cavia porcellus TaxID=10141 RepID=UPI000661CC9D